MSDIIPAISTKKTICNIEDLMLDFNSVSGTIEDILQGNVSKTSWEVDIIQNPLDNKLYVEDGYHRIVEAIICGKITIPCEIKRINKSVAKNLDFPTDFYEFVVSDQYGCQLALFPSEEELERTRKEIC